MAKINIIARTNGVGLDRDVDLVHSCLTEAGHDVTVSHCRGISPFRALLPAKPKFDANIFLERVFPRWLSSARKNLLIPNQERFPERASGAAQKNRPHPVQKPPRRGDFFQA